MRMQENYTNYDDGTDNLVEARKAAFRDASLRTPSSGYDNVAGLAGIITAAGVVAIHGPFAMGLAGLIAATPVTTIFALSEFGEKEAARLRAGIEHLIEQQPDKLSDKQLVAIAHAINITFVSPLWPVKAKLKGKEVKNLRDTLAKLPDVKSGRETAQLIDQLTPVFFKWEPLNDDFSWKNGVEWKVNEEMRGKAERTAAKVVRKKLRQLSR